MKSRYFFILALYSFVFYGIGFILGGLALSKGDDRVAYLTGVVVAIIGNWFVWPFTKKHLLDG